MRTLPRLAARTLMVTFVTVAAILTVVFVVITLDVRDRVRAAETDKLRVTESVFTYLQAKRQQDQVAAVATLAENPTTMTAARDFGRTLEPTGSSLELDTLTSAFNDLIRGLVAAEAETRSSYLGAIRALAAALDARDPYTAGHSERVSTLSVMMGRVVNVGGSDLEILGLGALLHDIGKIGVSDAILRKTGPLTPEEFEQIKRHPGLGARILRQVPFLAPHLQIVELHHERPDGRGYPHGLRSEEIPLAARIVHVADAFDAMTSARAYRAARAASEAFTELQRYKDTQFDPSCVGALLAAMPSTDDIPEPALAQLLGLQLV